MRIQKGRRADRCDRLVENDDAVFDARHLGFTGKEDIDRGVDDAVERVVFEGHDANTRLGTHGLLQRIELGQKEKMGDFMCAGERKVILTGTLARPSWR